MGSEMCIRDRPEALQRVAENVALVNGTREPRQGGCFLKISNSPAQDEGHIKWPSLRAELILSKHPPCRGSRVLQRLGRSGQVG